MNIADAVTKAGSTVGYIVGTGLALDATRNIYHGITTGNTAYYQTAAIEGLIAAYIAYSKYSDKKRQGIITEFQNNAKEHVRHAMELSQEVNEAFQRLFRKIDAKSK
jgi:hypothetical protein